MKMKIRPSVLLFLGIIAFLTVLAVWFGKMKSKPTDMPAMALTSTNATTLLAGQASGRQNPVAPSLSTNQTIHQSTSTPSTLTSSVITQSDAARGGLAGLNEVPIIFYGRLEDQSGNPVVNAQIAASVRIYNGTQSTVERFSLTSDVNGLFQINHGKGESLGLMPHKDGYALAATNTEFKYSFMYQEHFTPDPNNPTIIKMWKLQGAEPLMSINQRFKLHHTNIPMNFDLLAGSVVPMGGDLRITVTRPSGILSGRNRQNWGVLVEAINGGLMDSGGRENITYIAPESGYQPSENFIFSTNAPYKWFGGFNRGFFMMSRNGQVYSKLGLSFRINNNPDDFIYITFGGVANTNSSRNWEATAPK